MNIKKETKIFFIVIFLLSNCFLSISQTDFSLCFKDSIENKKIHTFFRLKKIYSSETTTFLDKEVYQNKWDKGVCAIIFFTKFFDVLLCENVDFNYSIVANPPVRNSSSLPLPLKYEKNNRQYNLFKSFLEAKEKYEKYVLRVYYENGDDAQLRKDVNKIINSGAFCKPNTLRKILTNQYAHITKQKMYQEKLDDLLKKEK